MNTGPGTREFRRTIPLARRFRLRSSFKVQIHSTLTGISPSPRSSAVAYTAPSILSPSKSVVMSAASTSNQQYPPPQAFPSQYGDPSAHEISRTYQPASSYNDEDIEHDTSQSPPPPQQQQQGQLPQQGQAVAASDPKPRLRKACDSCSIRKVKVNTDDHMPRQLCADLLHSVTSLVHHVVPAQLSTFLVPFNDRVVDVVLLIDTLRPSKDKNLTREAHTPPQPMMRHGALLPWQLLHRYLQK